MNQSSQNWRFLAPVLISVLWSMPPGVAKRPAVAQQPGTKENTKKEFLDVFLPAPRELQQLLSRARQSLKEQRYSDAVAELGSLLDSPDAEDYFITNRNQPGTTVSMKAEARRLLGSMPARGRQWYELQFGAEARRLLAEAVTEGDILKLTDVSRKFFHTEAGYESALILGKYHLDRGHPLAAALSLKRVADTPAAASSYDPELSIALALAWLYAGMSEKAEATLIDLKHRLPRAPVRLGGDEMALFDNDHQALGWLEELVGTRRKPRGAEQLQWIMFRGNASRNARSTGGSPLVTGRNPLVNCRWRLPIANDKSLEKDIERIHRQYLADGLPALPGLHPLAVGNVVLMRTARHLIAVDFATGKRTWFFGDRMIEPGDSLVTSGRGPGTLVAHKPLMAGLHQRIWNDAPFGQVSSDDRHVFVLNDLGYPTSQSLARVIVMPNGRQVLNPVWPKTHNLLVALELASEGKLKWEVGGLVGADEPKLAGAFFLGAPLPLSGQLYALAEINGEIRLSVLDAETGHLHWSQQLIHVADTGTIVTNSLRRMSGASPSFADGVLICPTAAGAVVAVDISTRSLLWGYQYKEVVDQNRRGGIWHWGRYQSLPGQPGSHWTDSVATIWSGHVLITPPESDEIHCLNLLDGNLVWKRPRENNLFLACVHQGIAVLVGKDGVSGVRIDNGQDAWPEPISLPGSAMPSGRGLYSQHHYYLPTTGKEVVRIDLDTASITERIQTGTILGNLISHKNNVISQGVDFLTTFYQLDALRREVEIRLANQSDDPIALAQRGQLLLHDGERHAALIVLRRSHDLQPDDATRALLVDTLLSALREDFAANGQLATEVEPLIDQPLQRAEYLRLMTVGLQQVGDIPAAFETCMELVDMTPAEPAMEQAEPGLTVRRDRWVQTQLSDIFSAATPRQQQAMNNVLQEHLRIALTAESTDRMRRVIDYFDGHPIADVARLRLAERLTNADALLEAELLLSQLSESSEPAIGAPATALLARLLEQALLYDQAATCYRRLADQWGDVPCLDGHTGRQLVAAIAPESVTGKALTAVVRWPAGKTHVQQGRAQPNRFPSNQRRFPLMDLDVRGQALAHTTIALDRQRTLNGLDSLGNEQFRVSLIDETNPGRPLPGNVGLTQGRAVGHLLIVSYGFEVVAIDTLQANGTSKDRVLWRHPLASATGTSNSPMQVRQKPVLNPWGATRLTTVDNSHGSSTNGKPIGILGPLNSSGICYQKGHDLLCVDPLRADEDPIWIREGIRPGSDIFGDRDFLFVVAPGDSTAMVLRASDGKLLGPRKVAVDQQRWTTLGRLVLTWETNADRLNLLVYDPWYEEVVWTRRFALGSKGCLVGRDEIAVMQPDGSFVVLSLTDGSAQVEQSLESEPNLSEIYVMRSGDQYILTTNTPRPTSKPKITVNAAPGGHHTPLIHGRVYAVQRKTGQAQWPVPAVIEQFGLPLNQPADVPVLTFLRHVRKPSGRSQKTTTSILCLDKRDGRVLLEREGLTALTGAYALSGDPGGQSVSLVLPAGTFTFQFTDDPTPPEPPAQTGSASSLVSNSGGNRLGRIAGAILEALERSSEPFIPPQPDDDD